MPAYRIALNSRLIIEEGTTVSPNGSGLTFEVSGLPYQTLGGAVNASSTPITNLWSGVAFLDNREQVFQGQNIFVQPLVAQQAVLSTQLTTLGQVISYNSLSGTGGGGPNLSSELSGVQNLAISNQNAITVLQPQVITLQGNQSGINITLGSVQARTTVLTNNFSGLNNTVNTLQGEGGGSVWGSITGTLSDQTDLQDALNQTLKESNNLSDLSDYSISRTNLGLIPGVSANDIIQLDSNAKLPAVDGSQLTNLQIMLPITASTLNSALFIYESDTVIGVDGNISPYLQGYNSGATGDVIGFNSSGIACVTGHVDDIQLPITRNVGTGTVSLGGILINAGANTTVAITVTGAVQGDSVTIDYDNQLPQGTGGVVESSRVVSAGTVTVQLTNTDVAFGYTLSGNIYARVKR